jgi:hypothetical protein
MQIEIPDLCYYSMKESISNNVIFHVVEKPDKRQPGI